MARHIDPATRERVLDAAEKLFIERGYASVTLRDIGQAAGLNHASLYHHAPGGKEALYAEVMQRGLRRHHDGLVAALSKAGDDWQARLRAAAHWLGGQPPMDITRMRLSDMPALDKRNAAQLERSMYEELLAPIQHIFIAAQHAGARVTNTMLLTGMFVFMVEGVHSAPARHNPMSREQMLDEMVNILVNGLAGPDPRRGGPHVNQPVETSS